MDPESELLGDEPVPLPRERERAPRRTGPRSPSEPRRHRVGWMLVVLTLVAGSVIWYADAGLRSREAAAMRACETQLRQASDHADYRMGLTTNYVRPATAGVRIHIADLMAPLARQALPAVQRADRMCKRVTIRPWHFALVDRQHAATAYSGALVTLLQIVAAQGRRTFHDDATLLRLRNAAGLEGG
jgi:hypothetical protein